MTVVPGSNKPPVDLLVPTFLPNDAIGNDVLGMYQTLRAAGYDARLLAENIHGDYSALAASADPAAGNLRSDSDAILIYHHALEWKLGEKILEKTKSRVVIKYHNITPPEFYAPYNAEYSSWCARGREASRRLAGGHADFVWGDSAYNAREFVEMGAPEERCHVLPPMHRIEELGRAPLDPAIAGERRSDGLNILFVGALRPHKGHLKALDVFAAYCRSSCRPARLIFAGSYDPNLAGYVTEIEDHARRLSVESRVCFQRSATLSQLRAYYATSSVFLCVSGHEGFGVPLAEAMYFRCPIVAWTTTAVGETCAGCGLTYDEFEAEALAQGIAEYAEDPALARTMAGRGRSRYETAFHPAAIEGQLLSLMREVAPTRC